MPVMHRRGLWMLGAFLLVLATIASSSVRAQSAPQKEAPGGSGSRPPSERLLGQLLDNYATIAAGWYLEQRCKHFASNLEKEFDWNVAQINIAMSDMVSREMLEKLRQAARSVADSKTCGDETQATVAGILAMSRETTRVLTGRNFTAQLGLAYEARQVFGLLIAQRLDDVCKLMPGKVREEFNSRLAAIEDGFVRSQGVAALDRANAAVAKSLAGANPKCGKESEEALQEAFGEAIHMTPSWHAK